MATPEDTTLPKELPETNIHVGSFPAKWAGEVILDQESEPVQIYGE